MSEKMRTVVRRAEKLKDTLRELDVEIEQRREALGTVKKGMRACILEPSG